MIKLTLNFTLFILFFINWHENEIKENKINELNSISAIFQSFKLEHWTQNFCLLCKILSISLSLALCNFWEFLHKLIRTEWICTCLRTVLNFLYCEIWMKNILIEIEKLSFLRKKSLKRESNPASSDIRSDVLPTFEVWSPTNYKNWNFLSRSLSIAIIFIVF